MVLKVLYKKLTDELKSKIDNGELVEGDMLPKETELCKIYNVSRPTIRAALMQLVNMGYLVRIKGKGTFVRKAQILEKTTLFIESFYEEEKDRIKTEVLEFRTVPAEEHVARVLEVKPGDPVTKLTRLRYLENEFDTGPIVYTVSYFLDELSFIQYYDLEKQTIDTTLRQHGIYRDVVEKEIMTEYLDAKKSRLMGVNENDLALFVKAIIWDKTGRKIEYAESSYPAHRNRFILRVRL